MQTLTQLNEWRKRWTLLEVQRLSDRAYWYRFHDDRGHERTIVADGSTLTMNEVCALLDAAESRRPHRRYPL